MQYALDRLDELITSELPMLSSAIATGKPEDITNYIEKVKTETGIIRKYLLRSLQEITNREQLRILTIQYQSSLNYLLEQVQGYRLNMDYKQEVLKTLYEPVEMHLNRALSFIQRHFNVWICPGTNSTGFYIHVSLNEPEITAILCAFVDTGVITNQTYTSLLEFVAPVLATRHKKGLTGTSMLKSKDKLTPDMKRKVKDLLMEISREIGGY